LSQMVEVQEGSVVSRTLVDRPAGTVTLFAFDGGQGLSEHTAPYDALVYILEGEAVVTVSGVGHRVSAGEALLMPAGEPHSLRAEEAFKMLLVMVRG